MDIAQAKSKTDAAFKLLREDIISGKLPPDHKLLIEDLKQRYGFGASPLREALNRLSTGGFVTKNSQKGFRVAPLSIEDLKDITKMRILLETEALRESIMQGDEEWEVRVLSDYHRLTKVKQDYSDYRCYNEWEKRNRDFHESLVSACNSKWLHHMRKSLFEQHKRYRCLSIQADKKTRNVQHEHEEIKEAALARDIERACKAVSEHILNTLTIDELILAQSDEMPVYKPDSVNISV